MLKFHSMKYLILLLSSLLFISCKGQEEAQKTEKKEYLRWVDDIAFDPLLDDSTFVLCNGEERVFQYFNDSKGLLYKDGKPAIDSAFAKNYRPVNSSESGLVRIRFVVNCKGEADRYRLLTADLNYQPSEIDQRITDQLMKITKSLDGWETKYIRERPVDYYQYLLFKIEDGQIINIMP